MTLTPTSNAPMTLTQPATHQWHWHNQQPTNDTDTDQQPTNDTDTDQQPTNDTVNTDTEQQPTNDTDTDQQPTNDTDTDQQPTNDTDTDRFSNSSYYILLGSRTCVSLRCPYTHYSVSHCCPIICSGVARAPQAPRPRGEGDRGAEGAARDPPGRSSRRNPLARGPNKLFAGGGGENRRYATDNMPTPMFRSSCVSALACPSPKDLHLRSDF